MYNEDVAQCHVQALSTSIPAGTYMLNWQQEDGSGNGVDWSVVPSLIEKVFPKAVKAGKIKPQAATGSSFHTKLSKAKAEKSFKLKFRGIEEQIHSVIGQYLELFGKVDQLAI